jgi:hypothetical protein
MLSGERLKLVVVIVLLSAVSSLCGCQTFTVAVAPISVSPPGDPGKFHIYATPGPVELGHDYVNKAPVPAKKLKVSYNTLVVEGEAGTDIANYDVSWDRDCTQRGSVAGSVVIPANGTSTCTLTVTHKQSSVSAATLGAWRGTMSRVPVPKGCFKSTYPGTRWEPVPCTSAPPYPYPPRSGPPSDTVGNGKDFSAHASGLISSAVGSFDSVVVGYEAGDAGGNPPPIFNTYSLQLNSNTFTTSACPPKKGGCQGWQQFVFSNAGFAFIQYWMLGFGTPCPSGWNASPPTKSTDCWTNGPSVSAPVQPLFNMAQLSVTGTAQSNGLDTIIFSEGSDTLVASATDSVLNLAAGWRSAEFNVFGDCCWSEASFNPTSLIVVRTAVSDNTTHAPGCGGEGYTGETNNLTITSSCSATGGATPSIVFTETLGSSIQPRQVAQEPWLVLL